MDRTPVNGLQNRCFTTKLHGLNYAYFITKREIVEYYFGGVSFSKDNESFFFNSSLFEFSSIAASYDSLASL